MHAFLQERSQKYFQNELLASKRQTISLAGSVLRGRAQKDVFEAAIFEQKKTFKKMTAEVPEIKLVNRKKTHGWSDIVFVKHLLLMAEMKLHYNHKFLPNLDYLVLMQRTKNKLMNFSFVFKLYFLSAFNYVQLNYKFLPCIFHSLLTSKLVAPYVSSRTHPKK